MKCTRADPLVVRLIAKVNVAPSGCWEFTGHVNEDGYGRMAYKGKSTAAHRVSYILFRGDIPENMEIDHLCRNRRCVNPRHLEVVTGYENTMRGVSFGAINARKTHCKNGHPYSSENTRFNSNGTRTCMACKEAHNKRYREENKERIRIKKLEYYKQNHETLLEKSRQKYRKRMGYEC